jgi:formylglycine-generating enzyme required for sulfatase activity
MSNTNEMTKFSLALVFLIATGIVQGQAVDSHAADRAIRPKKVQEVMGVDVSIPTYHALIVGINEYQHWPKLRQARNDAQSIAEILKGRYAFGSVTTVFDKDATRANILDSLYEKATAMTANDALLVYFAGHGFFDRKMDNGYWIPCDGGKPDGEKPRVSQWIPDLEIKDKLAKTKARHVLVLSDACFSGALLRRGSVVENFAKTNEWYRMVIAQPTRWCITSGDLEEVPDDSVFAKALLQILEFPPKPVFAASDIAGWIREPIAAKTGKQLRAGAMKTVTDMESGEFVFLDTGSTATPPEPPVKTHVSPPPENPAKLGGLYISTTPPGALITAGRFGVEKSPATFKNLPAGANVLVTVEKDGYEVERIAMVVPEDDFGKKQVAMRRLKGQLEILSAPDEVAVYVDGNRVGETPMVKTLEVGQYRLRAEKNGYEAREVVLEVAANSKLSHRFTLEKCRPKPGDTLRLDLGNGTAMELVWIPSGTCMIGSTPEEREWAVGSEGQGKEEWFKDEGDSPRSFTLKDGFWLGRTEVTVGQWKRFVEATRYETDAEKSGQAWCLDDSGGAWGWVKGKSWRDPNWLNVSVRDDHPVACISWNDAKAFCDWLNRQNKRRLDEEYRFRLPGEAEWEYACRGGRKGSTKFWWGDRLSDGEGRLNGAGTEEIKRGSSWSAKYSWNDGYGWGAPVDSFGTKGRNGFGLADMLGNVWEWCEDVYQAGGANLTIGNANGAVRVLRGGSFDNVPGYLRCAYRAGYTASKPYSFFGFRVCGGVVVRVGMDGF